MSKTLELLQEYAGKTVSHPAGFGIGIGLANGLLAEGRGIPMTPRSAVLTALIVGTGEAALATEIPHSKHTLFEVGAYSALGILIGLWPFVQKEGSKSVVQQVTGRPALAFG